MAMSRVVTGVLALVAIVLGVVWPSAEAHSMAPAPAPAPASDGTTIDQGIACVLMLVALILTYLIHPLDASSSFFF
ncbi:hypothetical protein CsSME_00023768 [Camellia sinensis var. sinensis]|uniref:arabinogalactan protein 41-like n=1 Tax=Camellia sinensis TaxID=4442 RepID=UPI00103686EB|nr:arabinogalactan protein 41-like [Camellia sinensis]